MRTLTALALTLAAGSLAACATTGPNSITAETADLRGQCEARGGVLLPSGRPFTGYPALDNTCELREVTRISR